MRMQPRPFEPEADADAGILSRLAAGLQHARERRPCVPALLTVATLSFFGVAHVTLLPVFAEEVLGSQQWFAWIVAVTGAGAMIGALAAGYERRNPSLRAAAWRMLAYGAALFLFALTESVWLAFLTQFLIGYFYFAVMTSLQTLIQQRVDENRRGRVMSLFQVCWAGIVPFGGLAMGSAGSGLGVIPTLSGAGVVCAIYGIGLLVSARGLETGPAFEAATEAQAERVVA
jgi:predicted MFS family arabinose efflux permease